MPEIGEFEKMANEIIVKPCLYDANIGFDGYADVKDIAHALQKVHEMAVDKCVAVAYREDAEHRSRFDINHIATELSRLKKSNS